jgi:hypothetical protein
MTGPDDARTNSEGGILSDEEFEPTPNTLVQAIIPMLATKEDISELRADLRKADSSTRVWMIATVIGLFLGFCGAIIAVKI